MNTKYNHDFRETFGRMAEEAIINRKELALLLSTTIGAISQMTYRGELPATAFPTKRRACWFVGDIRKWLSRAADKRSHPAESVAAITESLPCSRLGRPRKKNAIKG